MPIGHVYVFGEMSIYVFCPFFDWIDCLTLSYICCLYILEINPLSVDLFANIFFYSVCCLFILFMISFAVQKLLSLVLGPIFFLFAFISLL